MKGNEPLIHPVVQLLNESMKPEPFVGYMAMILPLCLNVILRFRNYNKSTWWKAPTFMFYMAIAGFILISFALFICMNRPALVAAILSCIWVIWMRLVGWQRTKETIRQHHLLFALSSISLFILISGAILAINIKKAEEGDRRLLIWNVTTKAIMESPIGGTGINSFPTVYARTQAAYFNSGIASEKEMINAICPNVAHNEYLQIGLNRQNLG